MMVPELPSDLLFPRTSVATWLVRAGVAAAALAAAVVLARRHAARRAARSAAPSAAGPSPRAAALERLRALRAAPGDPVAAHVALAAIARDFVAARWSVPAHERTTEEIATALAAARIAAAELATVLGACDGVKFARAQPTRASADARLDALTAFVEAVPEGAP